MVSTISPRLVSAALLSVGSLALAVSIIYTAQIPALIGLGLIFWGIIVQYVTTEDYVKKPLLNATSQSSLQILAETLKKLDYSGKAVYLSPKYLANAEDSRLCITKDEKSRFPTPEQTIRENKPLADYPEWLLLAPPGNELMKLFERTANTNFAKIDLPDLESVLPKLLVDDLEIAEEVKINKTDSKIRIELLNTNYDDFYRGAVLPNSIGSPIASAIACALAKVTGKLIVISKDQTTENQKMLIIEYQIVQGS